ncbi:peptide/nickel transport system substrate-binding protein [Plantibacter sp. VKM Ac-1784]|uniref:Peptide/nickel transport system substrate-binding protein n=1 Tax=Plantibacter elymi (nom. nud.) TaxID=199708 RepID=A0ABY1RDU3_9MICO|nr:ABC transporter substrate-binding protein [Plantibacter sp. VKM Ac-1784]SMQ71182.1 peptide/nickel transport system substrate-binding protein [Plantibacter sp. VKM Ac-1784]
MFSPRARRAVALGASLAVAAVTLVACTGAPSASSAKELTVAMQTNPSSLDPALLDAGLTYYADLAYSPLIIRGSDGTLRGGLATDWGYVGEGNTTFQLTLRQGVEFSDGGKLTSQGVVDHLNYVQSAGATPSTWLSGATFAAIDDQTVQVSLASPVPGVEFFFTQFGTGLADVISPDGLADPSALGTSTHGAGPYMLDEDATVTGDHYVFTPNPNYWDPKNVHWDKVTIKVIANQSSILNSMKSGQVDIAPFDYTTAADAKAASLNVHSVPNVFTGLNLLDRAGSIVPALGDVRVRQAINFAIDRKAVGEALYGEFADPTTQTTQDVGFQEELDDYYSYDPDKARELLAEAGYPDGFEFSVASTPFFNGDTMVQAIAGQLAKVGITVNMESIADTNEWATRMSSGEFPAASIGYGSLPLSVEGPGLFLPTAFFNGLHSEDAQLTELYNQLLVAAPDDVQRVSEALEKRLVELAWFAPVGWAPLGYYWSDKVDSAAMNATTGLSPSAAIIDIKPAD